MKKIIDLTGQTFGRLTVEGQEIARDKRGRVVWRLACQCGNKVFYEAGRFKYGNTVSCGCYRRELVGDEHRSHGLSKTPVYSSWLTMRKRCYNEQSPDYPTYGGRGISVCDRWMSFENFYADMGNKPAGLSLERCDVNGDYTPENVVWADAKTQANNRRSNVILEHAGKKQTMQQWCDELGLKIGTVWARLNRGWSTDKALTQEVRNVCI